MTKQKVLNGASLVAINAAIVWFNVGELRKGKRCREKSR